MRSFAQGVRLLDSKVPALFHTDEPVELEWAMEAVEGIFIAFGVISPISDFVFSS